MSEVTSGPDAVSPLEEDSLEYQSSAADVMSVASNFAQSPAYPLKPNHSSTHNSTQMSLQELIEAELNSRLAPLQPDSLEQGAPDYHHEHIRTTVTNGDVTATCASLLDSLEASPFSLDSLVESGVDLTSPPNPAFGGSPPSPPSPLIHNSSSNQFNNINLNGEQKLNFLDLSENQISINSDIENNVEVLASPLIKKVKDLKTEKLIKDFGCKTETLHTEVKDIAESNDIILIEEEDNAGEMEQIVFKNITFEITTTSETVLESHCLQNGLSNGFEQKVENFLTEHQTVEKKFNNVNGEKFSTVSLISKEKLETFNESSEANNHEPKLKQVEDIAETISGGTNLLDKDSNSPADDFTTVNDFNEFEQPKKATKFDDDFYQADSFSDFKISHFKKTESVDIATTNDLQSEIVSSKISNVDFLEPLDTVKEPNDSNNFNQSDDNKSNNFNQSDDNKSNNFNQSESLPMETNHKLIKSIVDVSNSYNIIDVINNKDVAVYNNSLHPADVHVTNMDEEELWPEEGDGKKEELDEFQKMEQEVEREMEEEQKKKKKSDTDKKGKKKKKRKGESEKENKELSPYLLNNSFSSADEVDFDDDVIDEVLKDSTRLNGLHSPQFENDNGNRDQLTFVDEDDLANISVKQLTASYLSIAEQSPRKRSPSPNSTPIRPRTPISRLVGTYSSSHVQPPDSLSTTAIQSSTPNGTTNHIYPSDFTPGITLKSLKSAYEASALKRLSPCASPVKDEVHVSFSQLREAYCNVVASHSPREGNSPTPRSTTPLITPSTFRSMEPSQVSNDCRICGKLVFQMEKIVAEKASWHKNCFRCTECNKNLTLETYQSHEGSLYCKPHFKELFRPKAVVQDEAEERKDRLLRRPRMIILESQPEILPDDVVRATEKPDYGLEELQTSLNVKERFAVFESYSKAADEPKLESVSVRRSQSLMSKAARFSNGHQNGDNEDEEEEEEYESGEEMEEGEEEGGDEEDPNYVKSRKKKERPMSFSGMGDLKAVWEQKQRREEMSQARKEDISKFRQMLCAGKNITLKEMFESGNFEGAEDESKSSREEIKIEDRRAAHNLKARFEKGQPFILEDEEGSEDGSRKSTLVGEKQEVEEVFKDAQTAKQARNVFKQIDSKVAQEGSVIMRSPSFAAQNRDNRRSLDISLMMPQRSMSTVEVVKSSEPVEEEVHMDTTDLANRFKFFATFEERQKEETEKKRKVFRITPPREGAEQGLSHGEDSDILGRDPNLIKCTDNYQDDIDCRNTKNILQMFKKMEMGEEDEEEEEGPRPLKCFTPPPEDGEGDESEYSDEEYSDEGEEEESEVDDDGKPKFKDELLEMLSARKAANLRAKFEKWEEKQNELNRDKDNELEEECRPSLDTARNLTAMFEHKAIEVTKVVTSKPVAQKINRFV